MFVCAAGPALAQTGISHQPVACVIAGKYPRMQACIDEPEGVVGARVFFRAEGTTTWYHVVMQREAACFAAALPRPKKDMVGRHVEYYVDADHRRLGSPRTPEHAALVVRTNGECAQPLVAAVSAAGPSAVFPALPSGFAAGGLGAGAVTAVVAGGAAAGGAAVAVAAPDPEPEPSAAPPPTTRPDTTPPTSPSPPPPAGLTVACTSTPDRGAIPLAVKFEATASGGTGSYAFRWDFGDATREAGDGPSVEHVYRTAGQYRALLVVTSGTASQECARTIAAGGARQVTLSANLTGDGSGRVETTPSGIDCGKTCSADFDEGTTVEFTASANRGSRFAGWSGLCSGRGACRVDLPLPRAARPVVTAAFELSEPKQPTLTVSTQGNGAVISSPSGISCGRSCSAQFAEGTAVTLSPEAGPGATFAGWGGDCTGAGTGKCEVTMSADRNVTATFNSIGSSGTSSAAPPDLARTAAWRSRLEPGRGTLRVGSYATIVAGGDTLVGLPAGTEEVRVELELPPDARTGLWLFESQSPEVVDPGTLRVLAGQVVEVGPGRIAFRLRGGERASFAFRTRPVR